MIIPVVEYSVFMIFKKTYVEIKISQEVHILKSYLSLMKYMLWDWLSTEDQPKIYIYLGKIMKVACQRNIDLKHDWMKIWFVSIIYLIWICNFSYNGYLMNNFVLHTTKLIMFQNPEEVFILGKKNHKSSIPEEYSFKTWVNENKHIAL